MDTCSYERKVEQWGLFEVRMPGKTEGNPFTDYEIHALFTGAKETKRVNGFYDGNGEYAVRFMPDYEGTYTFEVSGSFSEQSYRGEFEVTKPTAHNHGCVKVSDVCHFRYVDGKPYYSVGTTCYAWVHQPEERQEETLRTLAGSAFNKIRFCVFPKHYDYNYADPITFPYEGTPCDNSGLNRKTMFAYMEDKSSNHWDFTRFNPEHFKRFDLRIRQLMEMGIEADLILFHPYDRWGFDGMGAENDDRYVKYVTARFSAYRNVWWSHGGTLKGESPDRISFLHKILSEIPGGYGLKQIPAYWDAVAGTIDRDSDKDRKVKDYYLFYFSFLRPLYRDLYFDEDTEFQVDLIDTWNMTIVTQGIYKGHFRIVTGGRPYMALRVQRVSEETV